MPAPYNDLDLKGELALQTVIRNGATGIPNEQIFGSFQDALEPTMGQDCVEITCLGGLEDGTDSGNERLTFSVKVKSSSTVQLLPDGTQEAAAAPRARHRTNCAKVFDVLKSTTLHTDLSGAIPDFTAFADIVTRRGANRIEDNHFTSEMFVEMTCAPSDIS